MPSVGFAAPDALEIGATSVPTGIAAGTWLGIAAPTFQVVGDRLEAAGDFGEAR